MSVVDELHSNDYFVAEISWFSYLEFSVKKESDVETRF
jgi:hypothetical protein